MRIRAHAGDQTSVFGSPDLTGFPLDDRDPVYFAETSLKFLGTSVKLA